MLEVLSTETLIKFNNCKFNDNKAKQGTPNLFFSDSTQIEIIGCTFFNRDTPTYSTDSINGAFI